MKSGKQIFALTILSLGVYRFSQAFLMQQVQKVSAADTTVEKEDSKALMGNELNITVKNYPTKTIESSESSASATQTEQPDSQTPSNQRTTSQSTVPAKKIPKTQGNQSAQDTIVQETPKVTAASRSQADNDDIANPDSVQETKKVNKKHQKISKQVLHQQGQGNDHQDQKQTDFLKHHAQVEKDIAMFQQSMTPNTPSGGAVTQVGAVFGALAGQGLYAVQNEIE